MYYPPGKRQCCIPAATVCNNQQEIMLLDSINSKTPPLGQALMAASTPVAIASDQSPIPITATLPAGSATAANQAIQITQGIDLLARTPVLGQAAMVASTPVTIANDQSAIPVTAPGLATEATLVQLDNKVPALGQAAMAASLPVTIANDQTVIPVTAPGLATEATLTQLDNKVPALGQAAMAASQPVTIANDQSAVPVTGTVGVTGVATEATLSQLNTKMPALGQATMAASQPVVFASNQSPVTIQSISVDTMNVSSGLLIIGNNNKTQFGLTTLQAAGVTGGSISPIPANFDYYIDSIIVSVGSTGPSAILLEVQNDTSPISLGSPAFFQTYAGSATATVGALTTEQIAIPHGMRVPSGTHLGAAVTQSTTPPAALLMTIAFIGRLVPI